MTSNKRKITILLTAVLALSLLLTACGTGGDTPIGDNTTPGVSETPDNTPGGENTNTPDSSSTPAGTPDESNPPDTTTPPKLEKPPTLDIPYGNDEASKEAKEGIDRHIDLFNERAGIDVENIIGNTYKEYGEFLNENINEDAIRVGIALSTTSSYTSKDNVTGISPDTLEKVNTFLKDKGKEPLNDITNPEQNVTALLIAASLFYDPDVTNGYPGYDIAMAFGTARADSRPDDAERNANGFWSPYVSLFGGPFVLAEAMK